MFKRTTFVLGAGFSAEQQFPLVRGLRQKVIHFLEAERHSTYETHLNPCDLFPSGQFYDGLACVDPSGELGFEELLIALRKHLASADNLDPCFVTDQVLRVGTARLFWSKTWFGRPVEKCYREFAGWLVAGRGARNVVTFNWDILIEQALSEIRSAWAYTLDSGTANPAVLKPHGSINWSGWARNPASSSPYTGWTPVGTGSRLRFDGANPLDNPDTYEIHPDLRVCLFPGDPDLPREDPDLELIWRDVSSVIVGSDEVVFIGYCLPEYDTYGASELIRLCRGKDVAVYDPSDQTLARFKAGFHGAVLYKQEFRQSPYAKPEGAA